MTLSFNALRVEPEIACRLPSGTADVVTLSCIHYQYFTRNKASCVLVVFGLRSR